MIGELPYVDVGLGCVVFGHVLEEIILRHAMRSNPAAAKQLEIVRKDERHMAVANQAKAI